MNKILKKTHQYYLFIECLVLSVVLLAAAVAFPTTDTSFETKTEITKVDNLSNLFTFELPEKNYGALNINLSAVIQYKKIDDVSNWALSFRTTLRGEEKQDVQKFLPEDIQYNGNQTEEIVFFNKHFVNVTTPVIKVSIVARNPSIKGIIMKLVFSSTKNFPVIICAYSAFYYLFFSLKQLKMIIFILLYFVSFAPYTELFHPFLRLQFGAFASYFILSHTAKHSTQVNKLSRALGNLSIVVSVLIAITSAVLCTTKGQESALSSPFALLVGICVIQLPILIASNQANALPIYFDIIGGICTIAPYFMRYYLPIYLSDFHSAASSEIISVILPLHAIMCFIISDSCLERGQVVSEDLMGVINIESTSSDYHVEYERSDDLKLGRVRKINFLSIIAVAVPTIVSLFAVVYQQFVSGPQPTFELTQP
jgi:hypothetical protein